MVVDDMKKHVALHLQSKVLFWNKKNKEKQTWLMA